MENTEYNEFNQDNNNSNKLIIGLLAVSIIANLVLGFMVFQQKGDIETITGQKTELSEEKDQIETELYDMLAQYDSLETTNDTLNAQLASEKARVEELIAKVKNSNWTIYKLKKETESLRKIMKGFVVTIDSLNTANQHLISENKEIKGAFENEKNKTKELTDIKDQLSQKVKIGERLSTTSIEAFAQRVKSNTIHKPTDKASRADKIKCCFTISENELTKSGNRPVYLRVLTPNGQVLSQGKGEDSMFEFDGVRGLYSVKKDVIYENQELDVCMYWVVDEPLVRGKYLVYVYIDNHQIGTTSFVLK